MDDSTLFMDELEAIYQEGTLVDGVCRKAISLKDGEVAPLGINMVDSMKAGTVEFWFRPGEDSKISPSARFLAMMIHACRFFIRMANSYSRRTMPTSITLLKVLQFSRMTGTLLRPNGAMAI